jgi:dihydropyrimidine dehydrogenase (NAD+) subunit PreT
MNDTSAGSARPIPVLPPERAETRLDDAKPPFSRGQAMAEASRCLYCHDAPCVQVCPTSIDIPGFIRRIATDDVRGAARSILDANILGGSCARVCPVEVLCVGECVFHHEALAPVPIGRLQRYATDLALSNRWTFHEPGPATGKRVALVGAGPASLACAHALRLLGHEAVIFEKRDLAGGLNTTGVAPYKIHADAAVAEAAWVVEQVGIELRTGVLVGTDVSWAELLGGFDALFLGLGLGDDSCLGIDGEGLAGVFGGLELIERWKTGGDDALRGVERAVVIGGGNTALDVVRELLALGVASVTLAYRRGVDQMPGYRHEWDHAVLEGAVGAFGLRPLRLEGEGGLVTGLLCVGTELDPDDPTGRRLLDVTGSERLLPADRVVVATGQAGQWSVLADLPDVELSWGRPVVDGWQQTSNPKVFAGGDLANGGKEVVNAVAEGKRAAEAIDALLREDS